MAESLNIEEQILNGLKDLSDDAKREVIDFIEFLRIREDPAFVQYVNSRTTQASLAKARGEPFTSLEELQKEYA
ncbi:MAG: hypothetical protein WHX93_17885 [bacterium]